MSLFKFAEMRKTGYCGVLEYGEKTISFSDWWSGEGLDIRLDENGDNSISLHLDDLHAMMVIAVATGSIDLEEVLLDSKKLKESMDK
jgi:hypothetical protein